MEKPRLLSRLSSGEFDDDILKLLTSDKENGSQLKLDDNSPSVKAASSTRLQSQHNMEMSKKENKHQKHKHNHFHNASLDNEIKSTDAIIVCDDHKSFCPGSGSCCGMAHGKHGCCPYFDGVCCSNQRQCCPQGYDCIEWPTKLRSVFDSLFGWHTPEQVRCRANFRNIIFPHHIHKKQKV